MTTESLLKCRPDVATPIIGVSGGVGTTTLCRWLGGVAVDRGLIPPDEVAGRLVLVATSTASSVGRATRLAASVTARTTAPNVVLAVVGDSPAPAPGLVRSRLRALQPHLAGLVEVPYVEAWRYVDDPLTHPAPSAYRRALRSLTRLIALT